MATLLQELANSSLGEAGAITGPKAAMKTLRILKPHSHPISTWVFLRCLAKNSEAVPSGHNRTPEGNDWDSAYQSEKTSQFLDYRLARP
jgi:hypothetical protein